MSKKHTYAGVIAALTMLTVTTLAKADLQIEPLPDGYTAPVNPLDLENTLASEGESHPAPGEDRDKENGEGIEQREPDPSRIDTLNRK